MPHPRRQLDLPALGAGEMTVVIDVLPARRVREVHRGVDERDMRERLRKVADLALGDVVVLFGEEADVVSKRQQLLEELHGFVMPADHLEVVDHPERTGEKGTLASDQTIGGTGVLGVVAEDKAVA